MSFMTGVAVSLIFVGAIIFGFSFVLRIGNKNFDRDFDEAIRNFEKQNEEKKQEKSDDFEKYLGDSEHYIEENSENVYRADLRDEYNDDEDFAALMKQAKDFLRLVGIALIVIGIISFFL